MMLLLKGPEPSRSSGPGLEAAYGASCVIEIELIAAVDVAAMASGAGVCRYQS